MSDMWRRYAVVGLGFLVWTQLTGCTQPDRLALHLQKADQYRQKVRMVSDLVMLFPGVDHKESQMVLDCHVKDVDEQGVATVEVTIASIQASMKSLSVSCSYDSEQDAPATTTPSEKHRKQQLEFTGLFAGLKGRKYSALVDSNSRVVKLTDLDRRIEEAAARRGRLGPMGGDQLAMLLSESSLRQYVAPLFFAGLDQPTIEPNDTWTAHDSVWVPQAPEVAIKKTYVVKSIEDPNDDKVAVVTFTASDVKDKKVVSQFGPRRPRSSQSMQIDWVGGKGEARFSLRHGRLLSHIEDIRPFMRISGAAGPAAHTGEPSKKKKEPKIFYVVKRTIEIVED